VEAVHEKWRVEEADYRDEYYTKNPPKADPAKNGGFYAWPSCPKREIGNSKSANEKIYLSLVIPCFDEETALPLVYAESQKILSTVIEKNTNIFLLMTVQKTRLWKFYGSLRQKTIGFIIFPSRVILEKKRQCWQDCSQHGENMLSFWTPIFNILR
jgi:hypothetical protein